MKKCTKCGELKESNLFPKNKLTSDGLGSWCKACVSRNSQAYFKTDQGKEKLRLAQAKYFASENGKEKLRLAQTKYFASEKGKAALERGFRKLQKEGYFRYGKGGFLTLRQGAESRGIDFQLTESDLEKWWMETPDTCSYCGTTIEDYRARRDCIINYEGKDWEIRKFMRFFRSPKHKAIDWMTIDRADNSRGYELENMVKSCWICNSLKSDFFTAEEMQTLGQSVLKRLQGAIEAFKHNQIKII